MAATKKPNALTRKLGPLPAWAWLATGLVVVWFLFFHNRSAQAQASQAGPAASTASAIPGTVSQGGGSASDSGASPLSSTDAALLSQIQSALPGGGGGGEGVTAGLSNDPGQAAAQQAALDAGTAPSAVDQSGTAADPAASTGANGASPGGADYPGNLPLGTTTYGGNASSTAYDFAVAQQQSAAANPTVATPGEIVRQGTPVLA